MAKYILILLVFVLPAAHAQLLDFPENTRFYYEGAIAKLDNVQMNLHIDGYIVSGAMVMESSGAQYTIEGRISHAKDGIGVRLYDSFNKYVATIEASFISDEQNFGKKIKGTYRPDGSSERYIISVNKVAEFAYNHETVSSPFTILF